MTRPRRLLSRLGALSLLALVALLVWASAIAPIVAWKARILEQLTTIQSDSARLSAARLRLVAERDRLSGRGTLDTVWRARHLGEAAARVQAAISEIAAQEGAVLRSVSPVKARALPMVETVGVRVEAEMPLDQLLGFLIGLEYAPTSLIVDRASLRRLARHDSGSDQPLMFVQLDIIAPVSTSTEGDK